MVTICQECGAANSLPARQCRTCGMPLSEGTAETPFNTQVFVTPSTDALDQPELVDPTGAADPTPTDTVTLATQSFTTRLASDAPVSLALYFPKILFGGYPSQIVVEFANQSPNSIDQLEIRLESRGFTRSAGVLLERIAPGKKVCHGIAIEPANGGSFVLQCYARIQSQGQLQSFIAARTLKINPAPADPGVSLEPRALQLNGDSGGSTSLAPGVGSLLRSEKAVPFQELSALKLSEKFQPLDLSLDYQLSVTAADISRSQSTQSVLIPRLFLGYVQTGKCLKLNPVEQEKFQGLHLVAKPQFKLGRSRIDADFITWFLPRSPLNDERTRHLSKLHVVGEVRESIPCLRDAGSVGGSAFDGHALSPEVWEPIHRRGSLALSAEYFLDVDPLPSTCNGAPSIKNLRLWNGPEVTPNPVHGCIRFDPLKTEIALFNAVWLFTDAGFGSSRSNGIVLERQGLEEIQGNFHHFRGCFWIENRSSNDAVRINYHILNPNEIAPLISGQILQLGQVSYHVEVCD